MLGIVEAPLALWVPLARASLAAPHQDGLMGLRGPLSVPFMGSK